MSSLLSYCSKCGRELAPELYNQCPHCELRETQSDAPVPPAAESSGRWTDVLWAFLAWGAGGGFLLAFESLGRLVLWYTKGGLPELQLTPLLVIASLAITLVMQMAGLVVSWLVVTRVGKRPFWASLGWGWHPKFKWWHAVGLAALMMGVAVLLSKILPHRETELEKVLKMGLAVRVMVASLAVLTAPLIEELIYRGLLYSSIERIWGKVAGVVFVTGLFALVHVPQYWGSYAAITAILSLSLVLTLLRAWTGMLLPCVITHLVYNGIQAIALLVAPEKLASPEQTKPAFMLVGQWLGLV